MGAPKKYKGETIMYSYRTDANRWRIFNALLTLRGETPAEAFTRTMDDYIETHKALLGDTLKDLETADDQ